MTAVNFVRLSFRAAGSQKLRTVWAYLLRAGAYQVVTREGDASWLLRGVETSEVILTGADVKVKPARMSPKYGWLEVVR